MDEYAKWLEEQAKAAKPVDALHQSMAYGMQQNPDAYTKADALARQMGTSPDLYPDSATVDKVRTEAAAATFDPVAFLASQPKLGGWLTDPGNAAVSHDDLPVLSRIENYIQSYDTAYAKGGRWGVAKKAMGDLLNQYKDAGSQALQVPQRAMGGVFRSIGGDIQLAGQVALDAQSPDATVAQKALGWILTPSLMTGSNREALAREGVAMGQDIRKWYEPLFTEPSLQADTLMGRGTEFAGGIAGTLGKATLSGPAAPFVFGGEALGSKAGEALDTGATGGQATLEALGSGAINTGLAFLPMGKMEASSLGRLLAQRTVRGLVLGTGVTVGENLLTRIHRDTPLTHGLAENVASFIGLEMAGALQHRQSMQALADAAAESKLRARSPEKFQQAASALLQGSGLESFAIPADRAETLFQSLGYDLGRPEEVQRLEADLGVRDFTQSKLAQTDVTVPTATFLAKLTPEQQAPFLEEIQKGVERNLEASPEQTKALVDQAKAEMPDASFKAFDQIRAQVQQQLEDTGRVSPAMAEHYATTFAKGFINAHERAAVDPLAEWDRYGLKIVGPEALRPAGQTFTEADFAANPELDPLYWQSDNPILNARLDAIRAKATLEGGGPNGSQANDGSREGPVPGNDGSGQGPSGQDQVGIQAERQAREARLGQRDPSQVLAFTNREALQGGTIQEGLTSPRLGLPAKGFVNGNHVGVRIESNGTSAWILGEVKDGNLFVSMLHQSGSKENGNEIRGVGTDLHRLLAEYAVQHFPELAKGESIGIVGEDGQRVRQRFSSTVEHGARVSTLISDMLQRPVAADPLEGKLQALGVDLNTATNEEAIQRLKDAGETFFQPAYHGSPYRFDQFTMDHIGKGEGAQAYGWGLYFAGEKAVAEYYREALGGKAGIPLTQMRVLLNEAKGGDPFPQNFDGHYEIRRQVKANPDGSPEEIARKAQYANSSLRAVPLDKLSEIVKQFKEADSGQLYKVEIPEDNTMLNWDEHFDQQPKAVQEALRTVETPGGRPLANGTGKQIYDQVQFAMRQGEIPGDGSQEAASKFLNSIGISGIKYLDGSSRSQGEGSHNYVVFDANAVKTLETYYQPMKRNPADYRRLRARLASLRSLSPSHQSAELTRRSAEAQRIESELAAFEKDVASVAGTDALGDKRGYITFGEAGRVEIGLLEKANASTFLHEMNHFYVKMLDNLASREDAPQQVKDDYAALLKHVGAEPGKVTADQHEELARLGEAYLMEGKSPSPALKPAFARFTAWLKGIYGRLTGLGVNMTDEVRGVFDRLYASDSELQAARDQLGGEAPLFDSPEKAGMTPEQFDAYTALAEKSKHAAEGQVQARVMQEVSREKAAWWKEELSRVTDEVTARIDDQPVYRAFHDLTSGDRAEVKLNKDALVAEFGDAVLKDLPRSFLRMYSREGGMDAQAAAELYGFRSGQELIDALKTMTPRKEAIKAAALSEMKARHGDMMTDGSLADAAVKATLNKDREDRLRTELRALRAKAGEAAKAGQEAQAAVDSVPPPQVFRAAARELVDRSTPRDLNPYRYIQASQKASREAFEAMAKDDFTTAAEAKQRELMNHHLYLEAVKAKDEALDFATYLKDGASKKFQAMLGKADRPNEDGTAGDFRNQWNALAGQYDPRNISFKQLDRQRSLESWALEQASKGEGIVIDPALYNSAPKNWQEVPMSEMRSVQEALKNIETIARRVNKVMAGNAAEDRDIAIAEMTASAYGNLKVKPRPLDPAARSFVDKAVDIAKKANVGIKKMEWVVDHLDGGDINGPWRRYIFEPMALAQFKEYELTQRVTNLLSDAMEKMPKAQRQSLTDFYTVKGIDPRNADRVTKKFILGMALNWGNESNREKMLKGMGWADKPEVVADAFKHLNRQDWEFVQHTWDALESLWPDMVETQRRMTGTEPPKVERAPFNMTLDDGSTVQMDGGYYPIVYDASRSSQGARQADRDIMTSEGGFQGPTTFQGNYQKRVSFAAPLNLDFENVLVRHTVQLIKDISHREAATSVAKLIQDQRVRAAVGDTLGQPYADMMMPWLKGTVNDVGGQLGADAGWWKNALMTTRSNMVISGLAFRAGSVLVQVTDLGRAMQMIPARHVGQALIDFSVHHGEMVDFVRANSKEMQARAENLDRDTRDMLKRQLADPIKGKMTRFQKVGMEGLAIADTITSMTTWMGAYRWAQERGVSHEQSVREADRAVRLTMMSSAPKDQVAWQRVGDTGAKLTTMYLGDATATWGLLNNAFKNTVAGKEVARSLWTMAMVGMIVPILGDLVKARGPQDDQDKLWWAGKKALLSLPSSIPILRDVVQAMDSGMDYKFTPVANALNKAVIATRAVTGSADDSSATTWEDAFVHTLDALGTLGGVPGTSQAMTSINYLQDIQKGKRSRPESNLEFYKNIVLGPPPKQKK